MRDEKGITLITLMITILLMVILVSVGIQSGGGSVREVEFQNFLYEMQQIQGRVDAIHEKMITEGKPNYVELNRRTARVEYGYVKCVRRCNRNFKRTNKY